MNPVDERGPGTNRTLDGDIGHDVSPIIADTARLVADVLDGPPSPETAGLPHLLREIQRLRSAARRVIEAELELDEEVRLLSSLYEMAGRSEIPLWARQAVRSEVSGFDLPPLPPVIYEVAQRRMRSAGFQRCPVCVSRVLSEIELVRLRRARDWAAIDAATWQGAAS